MNKKTNFELDNKIIFAIHHCDIDFFNFDDDNSSLHKEFILNFNDYISYILYFYLTYPSDTRLFLFSYIYNNSHVNKDIVSKILSNYKPSKYTRKIFFIELNYAYKKGIPLNDVWKKYKDSIYISFYKDIYENYLNTHMNTINIFSYCSFKISNLCLCHNPYIYIDDNDNDDDNEEINENEINEIKENKYFEII